MSFIYGKSSVDLKNIDELFDILLVIDICIYEYIYVCIYIYIYIYVCVYSLPIIRYVSLRNIQLRE